MSTQQSGRSISELVRWAAERGLSPSWSLQLTPSGEPFLLLAGLEDEPFETGLIFARPYWLLIVWDTRFPDASGQLQVAPSDAPPVEVLRGVMSQIWKLADGQVQGSPEDALARFSTYVLFAESLGDDSSAEQGRGRIQEILGRMPQFAAEVASGLLDFGTSQGAQWGLHKLPDGSHLVMLTADETVPYFAGIRTDGMNISLWYGGRRNSDPTSEVALGQWPSLPSEILGNAREVLRGELQGGRFGAAWSNLAGELDAVLS